MSPLIAPPSRSCRSAPRRHGTDSACCGGGRSSPEAARVVTPDEFLGAPGDSAGAPAAAITVTFVALGDDASDYLAAGERLALCDGHDLGSGVVTRRVFA